LNRAGGSPCPGGSFFQHRLSGGRELPQAGSPLTGSSLFQHRLSGGRELPQAGSPLTGGEFFAESQRGDSPSADGGNVPRPAAGQEGRHQGFYPLNSHFLLFLSLAQTGDRRPLRKGEWQRIFSTVGEHSVLPCPDIFAVSDNVLLHRWLSQRRRGMTVPRNSLARYYRQYLRR